MTLYEINQELEKAFYECFDPETGEIIEGSERLEALELERDEKIENIALLLKNLKAEADTIKAEEQKLASRRKTAENHYKWLKDYLEWNLDGQKFKTARVSISYRKSQAVKVEDVQDLPMEYVRFKDPEPDKAKIKEALKAGETIRGAELVENISMIIK